jgi:hypothetical protein
MVPYTRHPSYSGKPKIGGSLSRLTWAKSQTLSPAKGAGGGAQVAEQLPKQAQSPEFKPQNHQRKTERRERHKEEEGRERRREEGGRERQREKKPDF